MKELLNAMRRLTYWVNIGVYAGLKEYDVRRIRVLNITNLSLLLFSAALFLPQLMAAEQKTFLLFVVNGLCFPIAFFSLYLTGRRAYFAAKLICLLGTVLQVLFLTFFFNNEGMELVAVLAIVGTVFLFEKRIVIYSLVIFFCVAYLLLRNEPAALLQPENSLALGSQVATLLLILVFLSAVSRQFRSFHKRVSNQRKMLEKKNEELYRSNQIQTKLFSIVSHDLKSPLGAFELYLKEFEKGNLTDAEVRQVLPDMLKDVESINLLIKNLLEWAKTQLQTEQVKWEIVDTAGLVRENFRLLGTIATRKGVKLESNCEAGLMLLADKEMVNAILRNLVSNAIKFSYTGQTVCLSANEESGYALIAVSDKGRGMTPAQIQAVMNNEGLSTYGTNQEVGSGLGLILIRQLVEQQGGLLLIRSTFGEGTTVTVQLPLYKKSDFESTEDYAPARVHV